MEQRSNFTEGQNNKHVDNAPDKNVSGLKETSMSTLITWNISKVIEKNPDIDLKVALRAAQEKLDVAPQDVKANISRFPEQRHIACALLAWKELGHKDADSLFEFFQTQGNEEKAHTSNSTKSEARDIISPKCECVQQRNASRKAKYSRVADCAQVKNICKMGPVVKIPTVKNPQMEAIMSRENKPVMDSRSLYAERPHMGRRMPIETTVMRLDNDQCISQNQNPPSKKKPLDKDLLRKIDEICCLESGCIDQLAALDASTKDLRSRAAKLARREAERAELLERAEAAWKDLEKGYQRRLSLALEKEEDITCQIQQLIKERNGYKTVCSSLVSQLKDRGDAAEKIRTKLCDIEKQVCERACKRLQLSEEAACTDATLAQQQCIATQLDRDLQFKEEQARRKLATMESELESSIALMNESERAMRAELWGLREQMEHVSADLIQEAERTTVLHEEIKTLEKLKNEMSEDLEGCKNMCDRNMQSKVDDLIKKREQLEKLKEIKMECRCKQSKDCSIQAKRTPSLAALCRCTPEDKFLENCSCTSLRSSLLSTLLADLFGSLQSELPEASLAMPCQMLKCLEDNHNWDRASNVKTNLRNFFSKLLVGELEIAIATSIEKYHARWVGASCADKVRRSIPDFGRVGSEVWQQKALERRAQQLAEQLAEKMFKERTETVMKQAKELVEAGTPCACDKNFPDVPGASNEPKTTKQPKDVKMTYTAQTKPIFASKKPPPSKDNKVVLTSRNSPIQRAKPTGSNRASDTKALETFRALNDETPECLRRAIDDVSLLRCEIDELKKACVKKNVMAVPIHRFTETDETENFGIRFNAPSQPPESNYSKDTMKCTQQIKIDSASPLSISKQVHFTKKKMASDKNLHAKNLARGGASDKHKYKSYKRPEQSYAINLCLCGETKAPKKILREAKFSAQKGTESDKDKQTKKSPHLKSSEGSKSLSICESNCKCLNKRPSNTSIDKFLETLAKWKCDLAETEEKCKGAESIKVLDSSNGFEENKIKQKENSHSSPSSKLKTGNNSAKSSNDTAFNNRQSNSQKESECGNKTIVTTESEYMGAVNLEKSNETFCRCVVAKEMEKNNILVLNNMINSDFPIKCLDSGICCTKCIEKNSDEQSLLSRTRIKQKVSSVVKKQSQKSSKHIGDFKKFDSDTKRNKNIHDIGHGESVAESEEIRERVPSNHASAIDDLVKNTELFPCDCDYNIKFLGVTLANESTRNVDGLLYDQYTSPPDSEQMNAFVQGKYWPGMTPSDAQDFPLQHQNIRNENTATRVQLPSCQCNVNINDLKNFFDNTINRQCSDFMTNENKNVDNFSLNYTQNNKEPCVCCSDSKKNRDETLDLEANTFDLIEEHLRKRFEKFKQNCESVCLPQDEENKFHSSIIQRIKQLILESTNSISCQCKEDHDGVGSWKRAYDLLQEYLKVKIKRVQCVCVSPHVENRNIVPDVTEKVCYLIKNDFERLRDICGCKEKLPKNMSDENQRRQPFLNKGDLSSNKEVTDQNFNCSPYMQTFCSQVSRPNVKLENKSCDAIREPNEVVQTEQKDNVMEEKYTYYSDQKEYFSTANNNYLTQLLAEDQFCFRTSGQNKDTTTLNCARSHQNKERTASNCATSDQNKEKTTTDSAKNHLPYIGYTVDCSCNNNLTDCICSKSTVKNNPILVNDIWQSFTNRAGHDNNLDYIMNNVKKSNSWHLCCEHSEAETKQRGNLCDIESSANCDDEIILKESDTNTYGEDNTTDTVYDEALLRRHCVNSPAPFDWLDYRSPELEECDPCFKSVRFPYNTTAERSKNEVVINSTNSFTKKNCCDCEMVPVCHVKMLVQNIENKLEHSECICDSMDSKVCPIHSRRILS